MLQDLKYALRTLRKSPGFAAVAVITLALGIGANAAIFSVVDAVLLRPLPYPDADRLVALTATRNPSLPGAVSWPDFSDWRAQNGSFTELAVYRDAPVTWAGPDRPERLEGGVATANLFHLLGVEPALGRVFAPGEDQVGANRVAILSYGAWQRRFHGDPSLIGRTLTLDGEAHTVVGVLPRDFHFAPFGADTDIWLPVPRGMDVGMAAERNAHYFQVLGRLRPGVTLTQARADMDAIQARLAAAYPDSNSGRVTLVASLHDAVIKNVRTSLYVLLAAVAFVLLIACANVASLLLARASARQRELAIRVALGASRGRLVRQMLTESVLLSIAGGAAGLMVALWGLDVLGALVPANLARLHPIGLDGRVLAFTCAVAIGTGLVFGLIPALQASGPDANEALKQAGARATAHGARQRARSVLVAAEITLAMLLLVGAGLMIRSFQRLTGVDPGFDAKGITVGSVVLPGSAYGEDAQVLAFYRELRPRLAALPGVEQTAIAFPVPFASSDMNLRFTIEGKPEPPPSKSFSTHFNTVSPGFFEVMKMRRVAGRTFTDADDDPHAQPVVVITEAFARQYFPGEDPVGQRIHLGVGDGPDLRQIVGVVGDVHYGSLELAPQPIVYCPFGQTPINHLFLVVRSAGAGGLPAEMREVVASIDRQQPVSDVKPLAQMVDATLAQRRMGTLLLGLFGALALLLAVVGVYGVMSFLVAQRTQEIGIRVALGARPGEVVRMVLRHGLLLAGAGVAAGVAAALALTHLLGSLLYGVGAADPVTFVAIAALLLGVAALACWIPARRAARVDPMVALRS